MIHGSHGRYLRVDPRPGRTGSVAIDESVTRGFLGGVGLGAWIVARETPAGLDPLAPAAALVFTLSPAPPNILAPATPSSRSAP